MIHRSVMCSSTSVCNWGFGSSVRIPLNALHLLMMSLTFTRLVSRDSGIPSACYYVWQTYTPFVGMHSGWCENCHDRVAISLTMYSNTGKLQQWSVNSYLCSDYSCTRLFVIIVIINLFCWVWCINKVNMWHSLQKGLLSKVLWNSGIYAT